MSAASAASSLCRPTFAVFPFLRLAGAASEKSSPSFVAVGGALLVSGALSSSLPVLHHTCGISDMHAPYLGQKAPHAWHGQARIQKIWMASAPSKNVKKLVRPPCIGSQGARRVISNLLSSSGK